MHVDTHTESTIIPYVVEQLTIDTFITLQSCGIPDKQFTNDSFLNRTSLDIINIITDDIPNANLTCHQDFINTGDQCTPSCVGPFVNSDIGYLYILTDVFLGLKALSFLLGGSACIVIAIIGRQYV